jgi:hypothetical protein
MISTETVPELRRPLQQEKNLRNRHLPTATAALLLAAVGFSSSAQEKRTPDDPAPWVTKRVQLWQPAPEERRFDEIGWASDLLEARRLAKEHKRPVFLFTHDGHMAVGRC